MPMMEIMSLRKTMIQHDAKNLAMHLFLPDGHIAALSYQDVQIILSEDAPGDNFDWNNLHFW